MITNNAFEKERTLKKDKHKHNVFPLEGKLFQQGVKMSFSRKKCQTKEEYKIPETVRKRKTGKKSSIFLFFRYL